MFFNKVKALIIPQIAAKELEEDEDTRCSICLAQLTDPGHHKLGCLTTPCGHRFHSKCLLKWLDRSSGLLCPMCRSPIQEADLVTWPKGDPAVKIINGYRSGLGYLLRRFSRQFSSIRDEINEIREAVRQSRAAERQRQEEIRQKNEALRQEKDGLRREMEEISIKMQTIQRKMQEVEEYYAGAKAEEFRHIRQQHAENNELIPWLEVEIQKRMQPIDETKDKIEKLIQRMADRTQRLERLEI